MKRHTFIITVLLAIFTSCEEKLQTDDNTSETEYTLKVYVTRNEEIHRQEKFKTGKLPEDTIVLTNLLPEFSYAVGGYIHIADKASGTLYLIDDKGKIVWYEPADDYSPNQGSAYLMDDKTIIYASTVSQNVGIMDTGGCVKWRYHSSAPMFRAIYIEDKDL